jgi:hypothetical protein
VTVEHVDTEDFLITAALGESHWERGERECGERQHICKT